MALERRFKDPYTKLMNMIKRDLLKNFGEKGIQISNINVVLGKNKLKVKMSMRQWRRLREAFKRLPLKYIFFIYCIYTNTSLSMLEYILVY